MTDTPLNIMVIDDDDLTAEIVERSLRKVTGQFTITVAEDGQEGLDILQGRSAKVMPRPHLILLDLNMPRMNGFEFLESVRNDAALRDNVIFVLTTSDADTDRSRAYHEQVAGYMVKSKVGPQFARLANLISDYSSVVQLPN